MVVNRRWQSEPIDGPKGVPSLIFFLLFSFSLSSELCFSSVHVVGSLTIETSFHKSFIQNDVFPQKSNKEHNMDVKMSLHVACEITSGSSRAQPEACGT